MPQSQTPIVVGVGDVVNRSLDVKDATEPRVLMVRAVQQAIDDTQAASVEKLRSFVDSIDVVASWTWPYDDLPGLIAGDLQIRPAHKHIPTWHGGNQPAKFVDEAAKRIALGGCRVAIVCGGEALASLTACANAKMMPPPGWTKPAQDVESVFSASARQLGDTIGGIHGIGAPIQVYPLYENASRAKRGQTLAENKAESAQLYAEFAKIAAENAYAWNYGRPAATAENIGQVSKKNRMICTPYPLLMNAFNTVNLAGACVLTSTSMARELGIPEVKWIYPLGGAGTSDSQKFWERPNYHSSPCIKRSLDAALQASGLDKAEIDMYDFYSCFPIVPKLACEHLGLSITNPTKPISLIGGLTSFGGAGNNYSMHAITAMARRLRKEEKTGLVLANGGVITYQHAICLSSRPRKDGRPYPVDKILPDVIVDVPTPEIETEPCGEALIETYTVSFGRDGKPSQGYIVGRMITADNSGKRFVANHGDEMTLRQLAGTTKEQVGRRGYVRVDAKRKGHNLFYFTDDKRTKI